MSDPAGPTLRDRLRRTPAFGADLPTFEPDDAPDAPHALFEEWVLGAIDAGAPAPQAMTVSTRGADGSVSARVVVLKDVTAEGWHFATDARSRKVQDLTADAAVAATFYWPTLARQVRLTGRAHPAGAEASAADFRERSPASRGAALATRPGEPLGSHAELVAAIDEATARADADRALVLPEWQLWVVVPDEIEFWQGSPERAHVRAVYRKESTGWTRTRLWP
ncbi:pyridoxine/pyridoxamine 5'-phosphate oxidase [Cellulomonas cellasea]|uniref:Pyridoxamine 5'-phosphate oxidase n=2 Tax=Cellulomonas cellasea TaxID=43670 RepID=A0A0A0B6D8_9CELL|nr:pyridoxal 5'-phosphate synthase [Cellulomonas cellasea]KGM01747.1 pyridoxamine 5'-phosphate oxidase [Cellulomonas cellasea DSM 20118]GEA89392.1 pyridoxamine 5'-phosphate oxidase [Cellulomonas cellasea]